MARITVTVLSRSVGFMHVIILLSWSVSVINAFVGILRARRFMPVNHSKPCRIIGFQIVRQPFQGLKSSSTFRGVLAIRRYSAAPNFPGGDTDFTREWAISSQNITSPPEADDKSESSGIEYIQSTDSHSLRTDPNSKFIDELRQMRSKEFAETMFLSAKNWKRERKNDVIRHNLKQIAQCLQDLMNDQWRPKDIALMLYSISSVHYDDVGAIEFIKVAIKIIQNSVDVTESADRKGSTSYRRHFTAGDMSFVMFGLQGFRSDLTDIRHLLSVLAPRIRNVRDEFNVLSISQSLYGLQKMSSNEVEVRSVIAALTAHVSRSEALLDSRAVGNALYGMREMSSSHSEVRAMLSVLTPKIVQHTGVLSSQELSNAMNGLQRMSSEYSEVLMLISALIPKIDACYESPQSLGLAVILRSLQGMSSDHNDVVLLLSSLTRFLSRCTQNLTADELSRSLSGLQKMSSDTIEVQELITLLASKMQKSQQMFTAEDIGMALLGMQRMSSDCTQVRTLLLAMEVKISTCKAHPKTLEGKDRKYIKFGKKDLPHMRSNAVRNALYGLQGMSSESAEVRGVLYALLPLIKNCVDDYTGSALSDALYGMKGMRSDCREVRAILSYLALKAKSIKSPMNALQLGRAVRGLGSASSTHREVCDTLDVLTRMIEDCEEVFRSSSVADVMRGMRYMTSEAPAVRNLLLVMVPKIQSCTDIFTTSEVSAMLHSLGGMSSECSEVRTLLLVLVLKIKNSRGSFSAEMVSAALHGLQGMSSVHIEARTVLFALIPKVKSCVGNFTAEDIGKTLYGLNALIGKVESESLLEYFYDAMMMLRGTEEEEEKHYSSVPTQQLVTLCTYVTLTLLQPVFKAAHNAQYVKWSSANTEINEELVKRKNERDVLLNKGEDVFPPMKMNTANGDALEEKENLLQLQLQLAALMKEAVGESFVKASRNILLLNVFESDITLTVLEIDTSRPLHGKPSTLDQSEGMNEMERRTLTINFEVNCGHYSSHAQTGVPYCDMRDKYLLSKGIYTVRVRSSYLENMRPMEQVSWMQRVVRNCRASHKQRRDQVEYTNELYSEPP